VSLALTATIVELVCVRPIPCCGQAELSAEHASVVLPRCSIREAAFFLTTHMFPRFLWVIWEMGNIGIRRAICNISPMPSFIGMGHRSFLASFLTPDLKS